MAAKEEEAARSPSDGSEEDSQGGSDEASSSGDEDEERPLGQRASSVAKRSTPKPAAQQRTGRTRVNMFKRVSQRERCGSCENCLNPQRKKACIVARQRQQMAQQSAGRPEAAPARAKARPGPADDPFTASLTSILSGTGGVVQERHVPPLLQLVQRAKTKPHRTALLVVLQLSAPEVLRQAVAGKLLLELQLWLGEFVAEGKQTLVQKALACLDKLPVTLAALQPPCQLGKIVGRLRKHESFGSPVIEPAKRLVARWKAMVEQSAKAGSASVGAATVASAKPPGAAALIQPLDKQPSANLAAAEDGDLFKTTDKQRLGVKDAVPALRKVVTIKAVTVEATRGKPADSRGASDTSPRAATTASEAPAAGTSLSGSKPAAGPASVSKVGVSPFAALGSLGSGITVLGGGLSSGLGLSLATVGPSLSSARERATAAAQRVPSPEPVPRKEKAKKLSWQADGALVGVRWFRKDDPPSAAQHDVDLSKLPSIGAAAAAAAAAREPSPPVFESAAKKEHLSEAAALRRHRIEEDQERVALEQRLAQMLPTTAWLHPLDNDAMSEAELAAMAAPPARGEDSTEAGQWAARCQRAHTALPAEVPDSPAEPSALADHGQVQHPNAISRIPLSLEAAAAAQQQHWQPPLQQQQQGAPVHAALQQSGQHVGMSTQQHLAIQQQRPALAAQPAGALPDISAALAQLAASGVLSSVAGSTVQQPSMARPSQPMSAQQGSGAPAGQHASAHAWQPGHGSRVDQAQQQGGVQSPARRAYGHQRPCRYFNTPKGCYMGDRCNFAHHPLPGGDQAPGSKRPAEGGLWHGSFKRGRT